METMGLFYDSSIIAIILAPTVSLEYLRDDFSIENRKNPIWIPHKNRPWNTFTLVLVSQMNIYLFSGAPNVYIIAMR